MSAATVQWKNMNNGFVLFSLEERGVGGGGGRRGGGKRMYRIMDYTYSSKVLIQHIHINYHEALCIP